MVETQNKTKTTVPSIIYGTMLPIGQDTALTKVALKVALNAGFTAFDSALSKGYAEEAVGDALVNYYIEGSNDIERDKIWIQTKFTPGRRKVHIGSVHDQVLQSFNESLLKLHVDKLNAYILHQPFGGRSSSFIAEDWEAWQALEEIHQAGKTKYIGISNINLRGLKELIAHSSVKPMVVQNSYRLRSKEETEILKFCIENGIIYQGFQALVSPQHKKISVIAKKHKVTGAQVILRFFQEIGMTPLVGASKEKHIKANISLEFILDSKEIEEVITTMPKESQKLMLSIYAGLQNGEFVKPDVLIDVVHAIKVCKMEEFGTVFGEFKSYISKIDPMSLADIISQKEKGIIRYLKQHGANLSKLTSGGCRKIIASKGEEFLTILHNKLNIPAETLLMGILLLEGSQSFDNFFLKADLTKLSEYEISQIVKFHPGTIDSFMRVKDNIAIPAEKLLMSILPLKNLKYFYNIIQKADLSQLSPEYEISEIIKSHPETIELMQARVPTNVILKTIVYLDDPQYFTKILSKIDLSKLTKYDLEETFTRVVIPKGFYDKGALLSGDVICDMVKKHHESGEYLMMSGVQQNILLAAVSVLDNPQYFNKLMSTTDLRTLDGSNLAHIINNKGSDVVGMLKDGGADFSLLDSYYVDRVVKKNPEVICELMKAGVEHGVLLSSMSALEDPKYFNDLMYEIDLDALSWYNWSDIVCNKIQQQTDQKFCDNADKIAGEIHRLPITEKKREAFDNFQHCIADEECLQCITDSEIKDHLQCYGQCYSTKEEL